MKAQIPEKRAISKMSINDVISANFQIVYVIKIVKTKIRKQKLWLLLYIPPFNFYVNFLLPSITFEKLKSCHE